MVFRNDFKDLIDSISIPFKPIVLKHLVYNETVYTLVVGEAITALFVLTNQKEKKLTLVQIFDMPISLSDCTGAVCIDYYIENKTLYIAFGFFDGTIRLITFPIDAEDKPVEKQVPKFFTKQHSKQTDTTLQLPISSIYFGNLAKKDEPDDICLIAATSLGYLICFNDIIKSDLKEPIYLPLKNDKKLDTIMECVLSDIDDDGQKELIAMTYLGDLFVIKKEENALEILASVELDACFYNLYVEKQGDQKFIILCGDNEVRVFEFIKEKEK